MATAFRKRTRIDTGTPITDLLEIEDSHAIAPAESMALRLARVNHERDVLWSSIPADASDALPWEAQRYQWLDANPTVKVRLDMMDLERLEIARGLAPPASDLGLAL